MNILEKIEPSTLSTNHHMHHFWERSYLRKLKILMSSIGEGPQSPRKKKLSINFHFEDLANGYTKKEEFKNQH